MSLDGTRFFYVFPLEVVPLACKEDHLRHHVKPTRQKWFGCACCPPNLARLLTSLSTYAYTASEDTLFLHLYIGSTITTALNGHPFVLDVQSAFPWQGDVTITLQVGGEGALALRIPGWCPSHTLTLNGEPVTPELRDGYAILRRNWASGDTLRLAFAMPVTLMRANPHVREDAGKLAVTRGPLVYCLEEADNGDQLHLVRIASDAAFTPVYRPDLLNGVLTLLTQGETLPATWDDEPLYRPATEEHNTPKALTFIPYYAWANRTEGEMLVWVHQK